MAYNPNIPAPTNRVQDDIAAMRGNFQHLAPLAPYIQALLDSRIVDHNLDVADPPNGRYVRWDNGLQICSVRINVGEYTSTRTEQGITIYRWDANWTFPAVFLQEPHVSGTCSLGEYRSLETVALVSSGSNPSNVRFYANQIREFDSGHVYLIAVGRWK